MGTHGRVLAGLLIALPVVLFAVAVRFAEMSTVASALHDDSLDCTISAPEGGWTRWGFDEDGFHTYTQTLAEAQANYAFEMPTTAPANFELIDCALRRVGAAVPIISSSVGV